MCIRDSSPDGRRVVVYDYKTGRHRPPDPAAGLASGTALQLPTYAVAAAGDGPGTPEVAALYWAVGPAASDAERPTGLAVLDAGARERLEEVVGSIAGAMASGVFPAVPDHEPGRSPGARCSSCSYRHLCAANRGAPWPDKAADPAVRPFLDLAEGGAA